MTSFEKNDNYSASYEEGIAYYKDLANKNAQIKVNEFGMTDSGHPLHEVIVSDLSINNRSEATQWGKAVLFINNAIHPGEPCGVDASMMLARDLIASAEYAELLKETVVVIIPYYNISGVLNRGKYSRANQEGPEEYGFRGNIRNYDLNRDFIKCDTKNAESFNQLYNKWDPDVFIDNHTSNGADYQYVITLIATQKDKLAKALSMHMEKEMLPYLYKKMKGYDYEMTPYVFSRNTPDEGIAGFLDLPRYSSGYAALHHAFSFMPETHMLKEYKDRVWSTYFYSLSMLNYIAEHKKEILEAREKAKEATSKAKKMPLHWELDYDKADEIEFKGYEAKYKTSEITGQSRLYYDRDEPYSKKIPFLNSYKTKVEVEKPKKYIIPQAFRAVINRLEWNGVKMEKLERDTTIKVEVYFIEDLKTGRNPFEGHYLHSEVKVRTEKKEILFRAGDVVVETGQEKDRYIVETLEPEGPDSFFAWNFMDGILMRKEYFSSYVFEDLAVELLKKDRKLRRVFEDKKKEDEAFAKDARAQLTYIYENSPHAEPTYKRYPIMRGF